MSCPTFFWGEDIEPGSKPTFVFPILEGTLHVDLTLRDPSNSINGNVITNYPGFDAMDGVTDDLGNIAMISAFMQLNGRDIGDPVPDIHAVSSQLANLRVKLSIDGGSLQAGIGTLSELSNGIYTYKLDSTETQQPGSVFIAVTPIDPHANDPSFIYGTYMNCRVKPPGPPIVKPVPTPTPPELVQQFTDLKTYINQAIRDLLGNQLTNKPTFRKDS